MNQIGTAQHAEERLHRRHLRNNYTNPKGHESIVDVFAMNPVSFFLGSSAISCSI